jgi:hypothetical protein
MVKGEGEFHFEKTDLEDECLVYFIAEPDQILEIQLIQTNFNCNAETVSLLNGWKLNGQTIPRSNIQGVEMCQSYDSYLTKQNAAMISIKLEIGSSFIINSIVHQNQSGKFYKIN